MTSSSMRAGLVIALVAICSAIVGAAVERAFLTRQPNVRQGGGGSTGGRGIPGGGPRSPEQDERRRASMLDRMSSSLDLTPAQRAGIDSVMKTTDSSLHAIRVEMQPRLEKVFEGSRTQIQARLTAEQREKFAKFGRGGGDGSRSRGGSGGSGTGAPRT